MTSINDLFAARVLEFTRAEAILAALVVDIDNMKSSLGTAIAKRDETLAAQLAAFRASAIDQWLKGTGTGMSTDNYEHARNATIGRARSLERRAYAAAEAAAALATLLEDTEPLITPEGLIWRIDHLATQYYGGKYATDAAAEADLIAMWQALTPTPLVSPEAVEVLRRHYDAKITGPYTGSNLPNLYAAVSAWRERHVAAVVIWDPGTWEYAVGTVRSWDEARNLWHMLGDGGNREQLSPAQNIRLRTALADRVKESPTPKEQHTNPSLFELAEAVTEFDNAHMWLMTRVRSAETMADLKVVADVITGRDRNVDGALTLMRALARKFDALTATATDADPEGDDWAPAAILAKMVNAWRTDVYREALACTTARGVTDYDEAGRYVLIDCALADARHTGNVDHVANLLNVVARVADAGADHILTADHIGKLRAAAHADTAAIELNGGTSQ
jgi:hypothetical protein